MTIIFLKKGITSVPGSTSCFTPRIGFIKYPTLFFEYAESNS